MFLYFNEVECVVINFTDISTYQRLKIQEENNNLLKTLNASVHHEMVVPLKVNIEMAERLKKSLKKFPYERKLIENILISSNMVLLHANDFLDQTLIERGVFVPCFIEGSIYEAIEETTSIVKMGLKSRLLVI